MPKSKLSSTRSYQKLADAIRKVIERGKAARHRAEADTYWHVGRLIKTDILKNQKRAGYGEHVFEYLEKNLQIDRSVLHQTVKFYEIYPRIVDSNPQLTWSHYRQLFVIDNPKLRKRLEQKVSRENISVLKLKEEIRKNAPKVPAQPGAGKTVTKLTPRKGILYTYSVAAVETDSVIVDCGFKFTRRIPQSGVKKLAAGDIIRSEWKDKKYVITPVDETAKSLYTYNAEVLKIIDADTLRVNIDLGFDSFADQILRLRGIDAPELNTEVGKAAKAFVQARLVGAGLKPALTKILIRSSTSDKYDRYLADVFYGPEEKFLNQELLDLGLAEGYKE